MWLWWEDDAAPERTQGEDGRTGRATMGDGGGRKTRDRKGRRSQCEERGSHVPRASPKAKERQEAGGDNTAAGRHAGHTHCGGKEKGSLAHVVGWDT